MQSRNKFLEDLSHLLTNAMGVAQGARNEAETALKSWMERWLADREFVTREEFEAVRAMAIRAREENAALEARIAALEARLEAGPARAGAKPRKASASASAKAASGKAASGKAASGKAKAGAAKGAAARRRAKKAPDESAG